MSSQCFLLLKYLFFQYQHSRLKLTDLSTLTATSFMLAAGCSCFSSAQTVQRTTGAQEKDNKVKFSKRQKKQPQKSKSWIHVSVSQPQQKLTRSSWKKLLDHFTLRLFITIQLTGSSFMLNYAAACFSFHTNEIYLCSQHLLHFKTFAKLEKLTTKQTPSKWNTPPGNERPVTFGSLSRHRASWLATGSAAATPEPPFFRHVCSLQWRIHVEFS